MASVLRNLAVGSVIVAGSLLWACGGDGGSGGGTTEPPVDGAAVRATVTLDGAAASGVGVGLFSPGGATALSNRTTGSNGETTFTNLDPGSYDVEVGVPPDTELASGSARQSVTATQGSTAGVTFELASIGGDGEVEVLLTDNLTFTPSAVTIQAGQTVVWRSQSNMLHTITPDGHTEWQEAQLTQSGQTFSHTFNTAGTFPYDCIPHLASGMSGVITVE